MNPSTITASRSARRGSARRALLGALAAAAALAGCGSEEGEPTGAGIATGGDQALERPTEATLVLDFVPNAVHTGIFCAAGRGYYGENNVDLEIIEPSSTADTLKLIDSGKADLGVADGIDLANQISRGRGAKGVLALVQRPLGGVLTLEASGISNPADLEGKTVGVTGVPSDDAVLEAVLADGGLEPAAVETVTIGFNGVQALENRKVDAITAFVVADGTQIERDGFPVTAFPVDEFGGPRYPGLVVFTTEERIEREPELIGAVVAATLRGYRETIASPQQCLDELLAQSPGLDAELQRAQLEAYEPLFVADSPSFGLFRAEDVEALAGFLVESGLAEREIAPDRYATNQFVEAAGAAGDRE